MGRDGVEGKAIDLNSIWGVGMKLLVNGKVVSEPLTLPFSLSFIRGDGLFETILGIDEKIIAWQRHYERLAKSAEKLLITIPAKIDIEIGINQLLKGTVGKSRIRVAALADGTWLVVVEAAENLDKLPSLIKMNRIINSNSHSTTQLRLSYGHVHQDRKVTDNSPRSQGSRILRHWGHWQLQNSRLTAWIEWRKEKHHTLLEEIHGLRSEVDIYHLDFMRWVLV